MVMPIDARSAAPNQARSEGPPTCVERWTACGPEEAAWRLRDRPGLAWLDSALADLAIGRWSIVTADPRWTLWADATGVWHRDERGTRPCGPGALAALAQAVEAEPRRRATGGLPFAGGAIGYLGFELGREIERLPAAALDDTGAPTLAYGWYDAALVWDGLAGRGWLAGSADAVAALRTRLAAPADAPPPVARTDTREPLRSNMTYEAYARAFACAQQYIIAGDIYQVNLAQRFTLPHPTPGLETYRALRAVSPAPFAAYLDCRAIPGGGEVLCSSPERFLHRHGDAVETRPIKGTRPRDAGIAADHRLAAELLASTKDRAEHVMIVDLERNDLGRIAAIGTVRVERFAALESYAQVHHLVSTISARLRPDTGLAAVLRATFPGGSVTGAPKIRAIEIIDELEPTVRGVYCGSIGYLSATGQVDLNIAIRTITLHEGVARFHVGGAIVHDSRVEDEYAETLAKARGMARALGATLPDEVPPDDTRAGALPSGAPDAR